MAAVLDLTIKMTELILLGLKCKYNTEREVGTARSHILNNAETAAMVAGRHASAGQRGRGGGWREWRGSAVLTVQSGRRRQQRPTHGRLLRVETSAEERILVKRHQSIL